MHHVASYKDEFHGERLKDPFIVEQVEDRATADLLTAFDSIHEDGWTMDTTCDDSIII
jgi:hypothetical protein